jgi:hypothetical protein
MDLRALRINCLLAPAVPSAVALIALLAGWLAVESCHDERDRLEAASQVAAWASLGPETAQRLIASDRRWTACAVLELDGERLRCHRRHGTGPVPEEPTPALLLVVDRPVAWSDDHGVAVVARLPAPAGRSQHLLFARRPGQPVDRWPLWAVCAGLIAVGAALTAYLARRIYAPVEYLQAHAQAALDGRAAPADACSSVETAALHSSVIALAAQVREGQGTGPAHQAPAQDRHDQP